ncbi:TPA: Arc family DNA-binding protein [Stenotrophomonas maltophilia]
MKEPSALKPHETVRSQLRLPAHLHQLLTESSERAGRSMNAEIVHRLERSFVPDRPTLTGTLGLRAELAKQREIHQATNEMLARSVELLNVIKREGGDAPYPGKAEGKSVDEAIKQSERTQKVFQDAIDSAEQLLMELAVALANGIEVDVEAFRERALRTGAMYP